MPSDEPREANRDVPVRLEGWNYGFQKIQFTKLLQRVCGLDLALAKHSTDAILASEAIVVPVPADQLVAFTKEATTLGIRTIATGF